MYRGRTLGLAGVLGLAMIGVASIWQVPRSPSRADVVAAVEPAPGEGLPWLTLQRQHFVDHTGRRTLLRGFNTTALLDWPREPVAAFDEEDADLIRRSGFNVVRLPFAWSSLEPTRGRINRVYLERIAATVDLLNRHGLYVVLDLHVTLTWSPAFGGAGAPRWAVVPLVPHLVVGEPGDGIEAVSPAALAANAYFWLSPSWQTDVGLVWRAVAERFRDTPGVVGYDVLNEPNAMPFVPGVFEERLLWPFYGRTIARIREVDARHIIFVEAPLVWELTPLIVPLPAGGSGVYSPHVYTGSLTPPAFIDEPDRLIERIQRQSTEGRALMGPAWWGELGVDSGKPYAEVWTDSALDLLDDLDAGWAWWQWRQDWGWGIRSHAGDVVDYALLRHVARPYLAAAPNGVRAGRGDGLVGALRLTVDAGHADFPAIVAWPSTTLGAPRVDGTCVATEAWQPASGEIRLTFTPARGCVVDLTAASSR